MTTAVTVFMGIALLERYEPCVYVVLSLITKGSVFEAMNYN